jgi:uncharacterized protein YndB with AHSA1/START domain
MQRQDFTTTFTVDQTPAEVFAAINNVRGWWTGEIEGDTHEVGDEFSYRYAGFHFSKQKIAELVPDEKVVWHVTDAHLEGFGDPSEWTGTDITFVIAPTPDGSEIRFSHVGLVPEIECFESCSNGWGFFVNGSLQRLITTGEGPATPPWA